jgi:hypothetical protein
MLEFMSFKENVYSLSSLVLGLNSFKAPKRHETKAILSEPLPYLLSSLNLFKLIISPALIVNGS